MNFGALAGMLNGREAPNLNVGGGRGPSAGGSGGSGSGGGGGASNPDLKVHADAMWKMLDELASSDPDAYKQFIATQMEQMQAEQARKDESAALFTPQPAFVLYTPQTTGKGAPRIVHINICASAQIPPLQTKDRQPATGREPMADVLIPLSVGALKQATDARLGDVWTSDVVFNPAVLARAAADMSFKLFCLELALQHLEQDEKVQLHRAYKLLPPDQQKYVGAVDAQGRPAQQKTEAEIEREKLVEKMKRERAEQLKSMATKPAKEVVMPSLAGRSQALQQMEAEELKELKLRPDEPAPAAQQPGQSQPKKKVLIEDLTPDEGGPMDDAAPKSAAAAAPAAAASSPAVAAAAAAPAKPAAKAAITLTSSTKLSSSTPSALSSTAASSASAAASSAAAAASPAAASVSSSMAPSGGGDGAWSSKASSALSSEDLLASLASIPVEETTSPWPYANSGSSAGASGSGSSNDAAKPKTTPEYSINATNDQLQLSIQLPLVVRSQSSSTHGARPNCRHSLPHMTPSSVV